MSSKCNRRKFVQLGMAAGVAAAVQGMSVASAEEKPVRIGVIGVGNRGTHLLNVCLKEPGIEVAGICDIRRDAMRRGIDLVDQAGQKRPAGYYYDQFDYRRMLTRDDIEAVVIATPMQWHAAMAVDALKAGKHVLSEVSATITLEECWNLVHAAEETDRIYMLSENCCYYRSNMAVLNMVSQGIFGDFTYAECGYVHDCRYLDFTPDGKLTWRGELARDYIGNLYPTHAIGPVATWLGINRGDRFESLVSFTTRQAGRTVNAIKKFGKDHPAAQTPFSVGDSTTTLIRTAKGAMIDLRYDTASAHPVLNTTYYGLQGTTASYDDRDNVQRIWIDGRSEGEKWDSLETHLTEFEHPLWQRLREQAEGSGHSGGDFFVVHEFFDTIRTGRPSPIDVYDAATWSTVIGLSAKSIREGGRPQEFPDFTGGTWETRKRTLLMG
ncbi:MAG TPA: Gfo/Idh/MocA family oxidoreductase [bacterium]|nr:Gfo/Idh/MocA family oxidoreductase [bacterium]HQL60915.1 Gfo/Idh/MocA family oxidoreductase [bacterium]